MSPITIIIILLIILLLLLLLYLLRRGGVQLADDGPIKTGTGPLRVPTVTVDASIEKTRPCDGAFKGAGNVTATYPAAAAGAGPPAHIRVKLKAIDIDNVTVDFNPDTLTFDGSSTKPSGYNFSGNLIDPCKQGSFVVQATIENTSASPVTTSVVKSAVMTIAPIGFKVVKISDPALKADGAFEVTLTLECCPGGVARTYKITDKDGTNVEGLAYAPNQLLGCPNPGQVTYTISGRRTNPEIEGHFTLYITDQAAGGAQCRLRTVTVS